VSGLHEVRRGYSSSIGFALGRRIEVADVYVLQEDIHWTFIVLAVPESVGCVTPSVPTYLVEWILWEVGDLGWDAWMSGGAWRLRFEEL
jgi:hypothetical protein